LSSSAGRDSNQKTALSSSAGLGFESENSFVILSAGPVFESENNFVILSAVPVFESENNFVILSAAKDPLLLRRLRTANSPALR
jgi:hypothetical protein